MNESSLSSEVKVYYVDPATIKIEVSPEEVSQRSEVVSQAVSDLGYLSEKQMNFSEVQNNEVIDEYLSNLRISLNVRDFAPIKKQIVNQVSFMLYKVQQ